MANSVNVSQLGANTPIVDPATGKPTAQFIQQWGRQLQYNTATSLPSTGAQMSVLLDLIGMTPGNVLYRDVGGWDLRSFLLASLGDVNTSGLANGYVLTYDAGTSKWEPKAPAAGSTTLAALTDVTIPSPTDAQVLTYVAAASKWESKTLPSPSTPPLSTLPDVLIPTPTAGQVLTYNAATGKWNAVTPSGGGSSTLAALTDVSIPSPTDGQVLTFKASTSKWVAVTPSGGGSTAPGIVQVASVAATGGPPTCTFAAAPTVGNIMIFIGSRWASAAAETTGWTRIYFSPGASGMAVAMAYRVVLAGDTAAQTPYTGGAGWDGTLFELVNVGPGQITSNTQLQDQNSSPITLSPTVSNGSLVVGSFMCDNAARSPITITGATAAGPLVTDPGGGTGGPYAVQGFQLAATTTGSVSITAAYGTAGSFMQGACVVVAPAVPPAPAQTAFQASLAVATQAVASGSTATKVVMDTVNIDTGSYWSVSNSRYTPLIAGTYYFHGQILLGGVNPTRINASIYKNGALVAPATMNGTFTAGSEMTVGCMLAMNGTTDYVELWGAVTATSGTQFGITTGGLATFFEGFKIG